MLSNLPLKLGQKLVLFTLLAVLPPLIIAGIYTYRLMKEQVLLYTNNAQLNSLNFVKYQLNSELDHLVNTAKVIATDPALRKALDRGVSLGLNSQLNRLASVYPELNYLVLLDARQTVFAISTINHAKVRLNSEDLLGNKLDDHPLLPQLLSHPTYSAPGKDPYLKLFNLEPGYAQWFSAPVIVRGQPAGWLLLSYRWQKSVSKLQKAITDDLNTRGLETLGGAITNHDDQLMAGFMSNIANVQQQSIPFIIADQSFNLILQTDQAVQLKAIAQQRNQLLQVATPFLLIIFAIFYYVVYKQLLVRINKLDAGTQKFAEGDFKFQLEVSGRDELSQLSRSFNTLGQRLLNARTNLESKVEQRTFELTQSNQKLEAAIKEATEANQIKSEFLASMSHEIRTPMNGVLGMIDLLQNSPLNEKQSHFTHLAKTSADALLCVINDILDFSKIEAGMLNLEMIEFDLEAMFGDFAETFAIAAEQKPIEFILNMSQVRCLQVRGDPGRLRQILNNIVGNALKFTLKGEIEITVATKQIDDFELLTCLVRDTGIGIPKSALSNLFNAFTQVDSSTTRKYGGTGLGLAIVSQLCQLMGGKISATSELGKGSIFAIEILLNKTASENVKITQPNLTGKHMMMVDDNQTCRNMMEQQLTSWGANVTKACDAQAAQLLFENAPLNTFDVAIIDADMPGTNGETLIRQLTKRQLVGQTKLVLCTPINNTDDTALFRELGCAGYLHKPLRISTLHQLLGNIDELSFSAPFEAGLEENPEDSAPKPAETRPQTPITPKVQYRILLVEDNQINQVVAHEVLKRLGLVVSIANNGQEALNLLNAGGDPCPYDLIIMDCQMPVMDGYQATDSIRKGLAGKCNEQITIIAMTANVMSGDEEKCLSCGMNDYFSKPIVPDLLKTKLRQYLPDL